MGLLQLNYLQPLDTQTDNDDVNKRRCWSKGQRSEAEAEAASESSSSKSLQSKSLQSNSVGARTRRVGLKWQRTGRRSAQAQAQADFMTVAVNFVASTQGMRKTSRSHREATNAGQVTDELIAHYEIDVEQNGQDTWCSRVTSSS